MFARRIVQSVKAPSTISKRLASTRSLSNAVIADINTRWEDLPADDQQHIVQQLSDRQKLPWGELTPAEKKASWYISYGEWGPRRPVHSKGDAGKIFGGVVIGLGTALGIFLAVRAVSGPAPLTMNREWQEKSDEYLKSKNANPWGTYSQIQSN
ncbi:cytochrome c oxidase subunit Va [Saccharomycopsis crataegensis]|uniref:Cytochrome c oxidase subunit Va n=1 Tax=Saccharomycopsis crataegensis TaxID=43959 RepID=A0AAV5QF24_9ASCO|nr:cytochrome c oxidase subunit Va [Saccharomycopsis crataegensis]